MMVLLSLIIKYLIEISIIVTVCAYFNHVMWGIGFDFLICLFAFISAPAAFGKVFWIIFFIFTLWLIYYVLSIPVRMSKKTQKRIDRIRNNTIDRFRKIVPYMNLNYLVHLPTNIMDSKDAPKINNQQYTHLFDRIISNLISHNVFLAFKRYCKSNGLSVLRKQINYINSSNLMPFQIPHINNFARFSKILHKIDKDTTNLQKGNRGESKFYNTLSYKLRHNPTHPYNNPDDFIINDMNLPYIYPHKREPKPNQNDVTLICPRGIFSFEVKNYGYPYLWINEKGCLVKSDTDLPSKRTKVVKGNRILYQTMNHINAIRGQLYKLPYGKQYAKLFRNHIYSPMTYVNPKNMFCYDSPCNFSKKLGIEVTNPSDCLKYIEAHPVIRDSNYSGITRQDAQEVKQGLEAISDRTKEQPRHHYYLVGPYILTFQMLKQYEQNINQLYEICAGTEQSLRMAIQRENRYKYMWPGVQAAYYQLKSFF